VNSEDIANVYESKACETSINLKLNSDGSYQFLYLNKKTPQSQQLTGRWQMTSYPYIELISVDNMWRFYYEIEKNIITDVVGKIDLIELKPVDDHYKLPKCRFAYGLRK
jgi:hypothetical protein